MERERWLQMYRAARRLDKGTCRGVFSAAVVVGVFLWSALHDRPVRWACVAENWPPGLWRYALPSQATMSRRLRDPRVRELLARAYEACDADPAAEVLVIDAKPLPVGGHSKDRDAAWGHAVRSFAKGYKFYAVWSENGARPIAWRVAAMNVSEQAMAWEMIPELSGSGYLLGDSLYDINKLYEAAAGVGRQLLAQRKCPEAGLGRYRHSPHRLRGLHFLATAHGQELYERRDQIERQFGGLTNFGGGLSPLPAWVRRRNRVQLWVQAKLLINAYRIQELRTKQTPAVA
jgi:hypothetical protein